MGRRLRTVAALATAAVAVGGAIAGLPRLVAVAAQRALAEALGPESRVEVTFTPTALFLLGGRLRDLRISAGRARIAGILVRRLTLSAERATVDVPALLGARRLVVTGAQGVAATAVVGEAALNDHLAARGLRLRLGAGTVELSGRAGRLPLRAEGRLAAAGGRLVLDVDSLRVAGVEVPGALREPVAAAAGIRRLPLDLRALGIPLRLTGVRVRPGEMELSAVGDAP
jgi:hypothetical protein